MKKKFLKLSTLLLSVSLVLGVVTGCSNNKETNEKETAKTVRVAIQPYPLYAPIYVAKNLGYLEDDLKKINVDIKWTSFASGPLVNESFASGQQDIGVLGDVPAILAKGSGQDNEIIGNAAYGEKALAVLIKANSNIKDVSELKGKKIAYVKGSYAHHLLSIVLKNAGLSFKDINSVNLSAGDISNAIDNDQVDAGVLWEPYITQFTSTNRLKVLVDGTNIKRSNLVIIANKKYAANNAKIAEIFLKAYNKGSEYIKNNPEDAAELLAKDFKIDKNELIKVFKNLNYTPVISDDDIKDLKVVEQFLREENLSSTKVDIDQFINTKYLKEAGLQK